MGKISYKGRKMLRDTFIGFQCSQDTAAALRARAESMGISLSQLILRLVASGLSNDEGFWNMLEKRDPQQIAHEAAMARTILEMYQLDTVLCDHMPPPDRVIELYNRVRSGQLSVDDFKKIIVGWHALFMGDLSIPELRSKGIEEKNARCKISRVAFRKRTLRKMRIEDPYDPPKKKRAQKRIRERKIRGGDR